MTSRNHGLGHIEDMVEEWSGHLAIPRTIIRTYLNENVHYILDESCMEGLRTFYRYAAECSILKPVPEIRLL